MLQIEFKIISKKRRKKHCVTVCYTLGIFKYNWRKIKVKKIISVHKNRKKNMTNLHLKFKNILVFEQ